MSVYHRDLVGPNFSPALSGLWASGFGLRALGSGLWAFGLGLGLWECGSAFQGCQRLVDLRVIRLDARVRRDLAVADDPFAVDHEHGALRDVLEPAELRGHDVVQLDDLAVEVAEQIEVEVVLLAELPQRGGMIDADAVDRRVRVVQRREVVAEVAE